MFETSQDRINAAASIGTYDGTTLEGVIEAARPILADVVSVGDTIGGDAANVMVELLRRLISAAEYLTKFKDRISPDWLLYDPYSNALTIKGIRYDAALFDHFAHGPTDKYFRVIGRLHGTVIIEQVADYVMNAAPGMMKALQEIAGNPCLDPEGNADIARSALPTPDRSAPSPPPAKP